MTPCWKHLLNLKYDSDPLFYLKVHEIDITMSIVRDREIDGRWEKLKRQIEAYKQLTLTMNKNPAHDTCRYFLQIMERLEKTYLVEEK